MKDLQWGNEKEIKNYFAFTSALKRLGFHAAMHWTVLGFVMYV